MRNANPPTPPWGARNLPAPPLEGLGGPRRALKPSQRASEARGETAGRVWTVGRFFWTVVWMVGWGARSLSQKTTHVELGAVDAPLNSSLILA